MLGHVISAIAVLLMALAFLAEWAKDRRMLRQAVGGWLLLGIAVVSLLVFGAGMLVLIGPVTALV
jgi:multisubunit Na+/H+ antiporter MnhB subunit